MELHGRRVIYRVAGEGPPVVLIHGMLNSSSHWQEVASVLATDHTVIAPDLIGHGDSAAPRGDYSLGAHAASIRDLLAAIGVDRATIVGHSLGGGVAMQFFYQFPQSVRAARPDLKRRPRPRGQPAAADRHAAGHVRAALADDPPARAGRPVGRGAAATRARNLAAGVYLQAIARALRPLESPGARSAFLHTLRSVIDIRGQRVSATDRLYLLDAIPTMILWGERDNTIPIEHGRATHRAMPSSDFRTIPGVAHFPHLEDPQTVASMLSDFIGHTEPAAIEDSDWASVLSHRTPRARRAGDAAA